MVLKKIIIFMLCLFVGMAAVNAAAGLNVVLVNQNPDPVEPGNFVYVNVKVSNTGDTPIRDATIRFVENENFQIAQGSDMSKNLGVIPAFSNLAGSSNAPIAKFKFLVDEDTPQGLNTVEYVVESSIGTYSYEFDILVEEANPKLQISNFSIDTIEAGNSQLLNIEFMNKNTVTLKDVQIQLKLDEVENNVLTTKSGSNQKIYPTLRAGELGNVQFELVASPDASSKPYILPITITFEDSMGNVVTQEVLGSVKVYSEPLLRVKIDSQEVYSEGSSGRITLAVANPGTSTIKGTQLEIMPAEGYKIIEGEFQYIGDLNPDDFQTMQTQVYVNDMNEKLRVKVNYLDSYNNEQEKIYELDLKNFSTEELASLGVVSSGAGSNVMIYIVALILVVVAFFVGRKLGFRKGKNSRK